MAILALAVLGLSGWLASHRPRKLRTPTTAQIQKALPGESRTVFDKSEILQIYSLNPSWNFREQKGAGIFHGYQILASSRLTPDETLQARRAFYDGISDTQFSAACFGPRHGLRATFKGRTLDLVICFHCRSMLGYIGENQVSSAHIDHVAGPAFDALLSSHDLPISP